MTEQNYFEKLNSINVSEKVEKKNNLSYLSWAWAWAELKKAHPSATSKVYETPEGCIYWTDSRTCWVKVSVTIDAIEHIEYLPVLDYRNQPIPIDKINSFNVNTSIQRAMTKAIARHGLGLYIYAGEDLPEESSDEKIAPFSGTKTRTTKEITRDLERVRGLIEGAIDNEDISKIMRDEKAFVKELQEFDGEYFLQFKDFVKGRREILETSAPVGI